MTFHYLLVLIQFAGIFYFIVTGTLYPTSSIVFGLELLALFIGLWAIVSMKLHTLTVLPSVKQCGRLCTSGPYRLIRHPMYTAVILFLLGLLVNEYTLVGLLVFVVVLVDLLVKINVEEKLLLAHYAEYKVYMKRTKRILPFVY